ncbi:Fic family protein [Zhihengliuella halotolerans]|uniref:type II toxin-antitoxin system death-on-curing family toxin n=1 Tax=Zhihengliuella halotolerans TaxID=370736 RepID=UPI0013EE6710
MRDLDGVKSCAARPANVPPDVDPPLDLFDRAALYFHGLASTQHFHNGNKRTAWAATDLFLKLNGVGLRETPVVAREALSLATAVRQDEEDFDETKVAEWLREHALTAADHVRSAVLAQSVGQEGPLVSDQTYKMPCQILGLVKGSGSLRYTLSAQVEWFPHEVDLERTVNLSVRQTHGTPWRFSHACDPSMTATVSRTVSAHWAPSGVESWSPTFVFDIGTDDDAEGFVSLNIDGEEAWSEHIMIRVMESTEPDWSSAPGREPAPETT